MEKTDWKEKNMRLWSEATYWKPIPGFPEYDAGDTGVIRKHNGHGYYTLPFTWESKTTKGTYLATSVKEADGKACIKLVHQLTCLAFHGEPPNDGENYDANHIDGDKHNNHKDNLEWLTHAENMVHAMQLGLRNDNIPVTVTDLQTGEKVTHYAMVEFARKWEIPRNDAKKLISRHQTVPYQGRWLFSLEKEKFGKINRPHIRDVRAFDYVTGQKIIAGDATEMQMATGIHASSISARLRGMMKAKGSQEKLLGGYIFRYLDDQSPLPEYTPEEAKANREAYLAKVPAMRGAFDVKDYLTGEIARYETPKAFAEASGFKSGSIEDVVYSNNKRLFRGFVLKRVDDESPWPEYSKESAELSRLGAKKSSNPLEVTDVLTNTTKRYVSVYAFAKELGLGAEKTSEHLRRGKGKLFRDQYEVKFLPKILDITGCFYQ